MERLTFEGNFCDIAMCDAEPDICGGPCSQRKVWERLKMFEDLKEQGRLVLLNEPMQPLVWGDEKHDTILCPRCLCDLMGGFEFAPSSEVQMFQCPCCGCPVDTNRAVTLEESEARVVGGTIPVKDLYDEEGRDLM